MAQALGLKFIFVARLTQTVQSLCANPCTVWRKNSAAPLAQGLSPRRSQ
jgi:hypothetical protein